MKKGILKKFAKFTEKDRCRGLCFNKDTDLMPTNLLQNSHAVLYL